MKLIAPLINTLRNLNVSGPSCQDYAVIESFENWKKEPQRRILRSTEYGEKELLIQKKTHHLPDEDMVFEEDPQLSVSGEFENKRSENWEDQFGSFYIKKSGSIQEMVKGLNEFYSNATGTSYSGKKRKPATKNQRFKELEIGGEKPKHVIKEVKIENDDDDERESDYYGVINRDVLVELCYYCEMSKLSLENCIPCYHDDINNGLNVDKLVDFFSLLRDTETLTKINVNNANKKIKTFFVEMVKKIKKNFRKNLLKKQQDY